MPYIHDLISRLRTCALHLPGTLYLKGLVPFRRLHLQLQRPSLSIRVQLADQRAFSGTPGPFRAPEILDLVAVFVCGRCPGLAPSAGLRPWLRL